MDQVQGQISSGHGELEEIRVVLAPELIARARAVEPDFSRMVNLALESYMRRLEYSMSDKDIENTIGALNAFNDKHGFLSDEFSTL
jgi:post-segregation antitoxin (ccd killing protein)